MFGFVSSAGHSVPKQIRELKVSATCTSLDQTQGSLNTEKHPASALTHACPNSHTLTEGSTADVVVAAVAVPITGSVVVEVVATYSSAYNDEVQRAKHCPQHGQ